MGAPDLHRRLHLPRRLPHGPLQERQRSTHDQVLSDIDASQRRGYTQGWNYAKFCQYPHFPRHLFSNLTCSMQAGGRPSVAVNGAALAVPDAPTKIDSRGVTRGAYRGYGEIYNFALPAGRLVSGSNTVGHSCER